MNPVSRPQSRLRLAAVAVAICGLGAIVGACNAQLGVSSSALSTSSDFNGITGATVLSPTSVKISWNVSGGYTNYSVFTTNSSAPLNPPTIFSSYIATGLQPNTPYTFSVAGTTTSGSQVGNQSSLSVTTWPKFTGITSLVATSPVTLQATWSFPVTGPSFSVYVSTDPNTFDFTKPAVTTSQTTVGIASLADGTPIQSNTTYYVIVRATYLDATSEYNSNYLSVTTPSAINPLPILAVDPVVLGSAAGISVSGALTGYKTSFTEGGVALGTLNGNGTFTVPSSHPLTIGSNTISASVSYNGNTGTLPSMSTVSRQLDMAMKEFPAMQGSPGNLKGFQRLGYQVAVGDFNCDGLEDLAISAPNGTFQPKVSYGTQDGAVYVFYGSASGLVTTPAPSTNPAPGAPLLLLRPNNGAQTYGNRFGLALAAGNLNADTVGGHQCDDLAVGTDVSGTASSAGEVWVFFGSASGLQTGPAVQNSAACTGSVCSPLQITPSGWGGTGSPYFGHALAIGKLHRPVSGDQYRDLLIGGPNEFQGTGTHQKGGVWIYYGSNQGINFINPPTTTPPYTHIIAPADTADVGWPNFGYAVAAVDLDHDGIDDLVIGAPDSAVGGNMRGEVYYYSSNADVAAGAGSAFTSSAAVTQTLTNPVEPPNSSAADYARFGGSLANAGDLNGDGYADLIVGSGIPQELDYNGYTHNQRGFTVFYGGLTGPQITNGCVTSSNTEGSMPNLYGLTCTTATASPCTTSGSPATCKIQTIAYSNSVNPSMYMPIQVYGSNADGGQDVNGDGINDAIVGWPLYTPGGTTVSRAAVYYGSTSGLSTAASLIKPLVSGTYDNLGFGVALGDFNGDGYSDAAVSAPDDMALNGDYGGVVYEFNGQSGSLPSSTTNYSQLVDPNLSYETFVGSYAAAAGDVNGDGYTDAIARFCRPESFRGSGYLWGTECPMVMYYGSATGLNTSAAPSYAPASPTDPTIIPSYSGNNGQAYFYGVSPAGDVNGDGYGDIVGSSNSNLYLYYGSPTGLQTANLPSATPVNPLDPMIVAQGYNAFSWTDLIWGWTNFGITYGDFNGDGYSDIALGCTSTTTGNCPSGGEVMVIYGGANGIQSDGLLSHTGGDVVTSSPCSGTPPSLTCKAQILVPLTTTEAFGDSVAAPGDINGDGYGDLVVGAPGNSIAGTQAGAAYVFYGSQSGLTLWNSTTSGLLVVPPMITATTNRYAGANVAPAGDVNGDGYADFMIGSYHDAATGGGGGAYLFYGCANGMNGTSPEPGCPSTGIWGITTSGVAPTTTSVATNTSSCSAGVCQPLLFWPTGVNLVTGNGSIYSWSSSMGPAGDMNKDGYADVFLGSFNVYGSCTGAQCPSSIIQYGAAVIFTGGPNGLVVGQNVSRTPVCSGGACTPYFISPQSSNWGVSGPLSYQFGRMGVYNNMGKVDFDGDGYPDLLINSSSFISGDGTTAFSGGFYIVH